MKAKFNTFIPIVGCALLACAMPACVDHEYDLDEDIDMTIGVGGDLTLPVSSTDELPLSQIFNLDANSSIKEAEQGEYGLNAGDYVLVQSGNSSDSKFQIGEVRITGLGNSTASSEEFEFVNAGQGAVTVQANPTINSFSLTENNVNRDLVSLSAADMNVELTCNVTYASSTGYNGDLVINKDFTITFDPAWTVEPAGSAVSLSSVSHNVLRFDAPYTLAAGSTLSVGFRLTHVDLTGCGAGEGLYERGKFHLESKIDMSGDVTLADWAGAAVGAVEKVSLTCTTDVQSALISSVTAVVDPEINVNDTQFTINDIPEFLSDDSNRLDISNPRLYLTVSNNSPVAATINATLASYKNDAPGTPIAKVEIGEANGTAPIIVEGNGTTHILLSQEPVQAAGVSNVTVPNLSSLLSTIPDFMRLQNIDCKAVQQEVTLALAPEYSIHTEYEAVVPLAFSSSMTLHYTHDEGEWDVDDLDKYNVKEVLVTFNAVNTIPLNMTPEVKALDKYNEEISNVTATVTGSVAPGTPANPSTNNIEVVLRSTGANLGNLDGVRLIFDATSDAAYAGINLNSAQNLRFTDIKVKLVGGAIIDLN